MPLLWAHRMLRLACDSCWKARPQTVVSVRVAVPAIAGRAYSDFAIAARHGAPAFNAEPDRWLVLQAPQ